MRKFIDLEHCIGVAEISDDINDEGYHDCTLSIIDPDETNPKIVEIWDRGGLQNLEIFISEILSASCPDDKIG